MVHFPIREAADNFASGAVANLFPLGQGNVIGKPIEPAIKLTGTPKTMATLSEHIDVDVPNETVTELEKWRTELSFPFEWAEVAS